MLTGVVAEYGSNVKLLQIHQEKGGRDGKSNLNFWGKYDVAMVSITSYTKMLLRLITFIGLILGALSLIFALIILILKITNWDAYPIGMGRGMAWLDTGSADRMLKASEFVRSVQEMQGLYISCIEEIAWRKGFITAKQLALIGGELSMTEYGKYLLDLVKEAGL
jgi:hypothetical protein